jgi:hypothetical protein
MVEPDPAQDSDRTRTESPGVLTEVIPTEPLALGVLPLQSLGLFGRV